MEYKQAVCSLQVVFLITALLMLLNLSFHNRQNQKIYKEVEKSEFAFVDSSPDSQVPNQYSILTHVCIKGTPLSRVNNRQGGHNTCFAACLAYNKEKNSDSCGGWTIRTNFKSKSKKKRKNGAGKRKSSTFTCFLYDKETVKRTSTGIQCTTGKLWDNAFLSKPNREPDYYDDYDFQFSDDEIAEYYYENVDYNYYEAHIVDYQENLTGDCISHNRADRISISCLQSSGCTLFSYLLAQDPTSISILDIGVKQSIPATEYFSTAHQQFPIVKSIILKKTIRGFTNPSLEKISKEVEKNFIPDYSFLFLRHPVDNFLTIIQHLGRGTPNEPDDEQFESCKQPSFESLSYGLRCGTPRSKLRTLNLIFKNTKKDNIVLYEELCCHQGRIDVAKRLSKLGVCVYTGDLHNPPRPIIDVLESTLEYYPSGKSKDNGLFWGGGDLQNTFHDEIHWMKNTEAESYRLCPQGPGRILSEEERKELLISASNPYKEFTLEQIEDIVKEEAPDILNYYNDRLK